MLEKFGKYTIPSTLVFIDAGATKLYKLEKKRQEIVRQCAEEIRNLCGLPESDYWTIVWPEALKNCLGSSETRAGVAAALGYLVSELGRPGFKDFREEIIPHLEGIIEHFKTLNKEE